MLQVDPFKINVSDEEIDLLKQQLKISYKRLFGDDSKPGAVKEFDEGYRGKWSYGTDRAFLKEMVEYWMSEYDWKSNERKINHFSHFTAPVSLWSKSGTETHRIHFIHEISKDKTGAVDKNAIPLLLIHGWPGSFYEFLECIPKLVHNPAKFGVSSGSEKSKRHFHVIVPSLPGYGFSDAATKPGMSPRHIAELFHQLMIGLGYHQYAIQGGDWGSFICRNLAQMHPESVAAMHLNMAMAPPPPKAETLNDYIYQMIALVDSSSFGKYTLSEKEKKGLARLKYYNAVDSGYFKQQATKPHTLGWALDDSPIGLLSWIVEKFRTWTDCKGNLLNVVTKEEIITAISIYWFTHTATSSVRIYYEFSQPNEKGERLPFFNYGFIEVPTAIANFPKEIATLPTRWYRMAFNLKQVSEMEKGGHFAAWEQPDLFVEDVKKFLTQTTKWEENVELAKEREKKLILLKDQQGREVDKAPTNVFGLSPSSIAGGALLLSPFIPTPIVLASGVYLLASKL